MNNEIKAEEIRKTKVFSKWIIFHSISLLIAFFYYAYLNPFNEEVLYSDFRGSGRVAGALGVFIFIMIIPWTIALVNRVWKKQPSSAGHFIIYYAICLFLIFIQLSMAIKYYTTLNENFLLNFQDDRRLSAFMNSIPFIILTILFRFLFIKANRSQTIIVKSTSSTDLKPVISRKQKEKRILIILSCLLLFIILAIVLKELMG